MNSTHSDVAKAVSTWMLDGMVKIKEVRGKTELEYNGQRHVYPHWLAVAKVNQIGASL